MNHRPTWDDDSSEVPMQSHPRKIIASVATLLAIIPLAMLGCQAGADPAANPDLPTFSPNPPTVTPVLKATETPRPVETPPVASVSEPTACLAGPGEPYEERLLLEEGDTYDVVGRDAAGEYWILDLVLDIQCWLLAEGASIVGDTDGLPEISPPVGSIQGIITYNGGPLKEYEVNLVYRYEAEEENRIQFAWTRTDAEGKYAFSDIPIGDVTIVLPATSDKDDVAETYPLTEGATIKDANFAVSKVFPILPPPDDWNACSEILFCGTQVFYEEASPGEALP